VDTWTQVERSRLFDIPSRPKKDWGIARVVHSFVSTRAKKGAKAFGHKNRSSIEASLKAFRRVAVLSGRQKARQAEKFSFCPLFPGKTRDARRRNKRAGLDL